MKRISEMNYENFKELLLFLKEKYETPTELLSGLQKFFPNLTAVQEMELMYVCDAILNELEYAEKLFTGFIEKYPEIEVDETGKSEPAKKAYWELELETLEVMYKNSKDYMKAHKRDMTKSKVHEQTINARELTCLMSMPKSNVPYLYRRVLYLKNNPKGIQASEFDKAEKELEQLNISREVLGVFLAYLQKTQKNVSQNTFTKHFLSRLLLATKDQNNEINKKFIKSLKKIKIE